eukprot:Hpha_TRINITY_DN19099_c0_g1::TRINITY_DN19099_c0_g1_i1::g.138237::m.138237/K18416/THEX1, ERI1; 3'-5' exoribonuclease 1
MPRQKRDRHAKALEEVAAAAAACTEPDSGSDGEDIVVGGRGGYDKLQDARQVRQAARRPSPAQPPPPTVAAQPVDVFLCMDFEATCKKDDHAYRHEIIEFPVVALCAKTLKIRGEFQAYVRPLINPRLEPFCTELTGITQDLVEDADSLPVVFARFEEWLPSVRGEDEKVAFATDGPWDLRDFFWKHSIADQQKLPREEVPEHWRHWVDVRDLCADTLQQPRRGILRMLGSMGMRFEGRQHSGIDDTRNVARILIGLLRRGAVSKVRPVPGAGRSPSRGEGRSPPRGEGRSPPRGEQREQRGGRRRPQKVQ